VPVIVELVLLIGMRATPSWSTSSGHFVFRTLEQRVCETGSVTPTTTVANASRPRSIRIPPVNEDAVTGSCGTRAVEKLTRYRKRIRNITTERPRTMTVIQQVRFPIFYLNKIKTYRVTHEAEIRSHVSFTSPHSHQVCLDTYRIDISICQVIHRKTNSSWACNHFLTSF
jgi:hypothetical protein